MSPIRVAVALAVITAVLATAPAYARMHGTMTRREYRHIQAGDTQAAIERRCGCTGNRTFAPELTSRYKVVVYRAANATFPGDVDRLLVHMRKGSGTGHRSWHANRYKQRCRIETATCRTDLL